MSEIKSKIPTEEYRDNWDVIFNEDYTEEEDYEEESDDLED